jgi:hypothetical protein
MPERGGNVGAESCRRETACAAGRRVCRTALSWRAHVVGSIWTNPDQNLIRRGNIADDPEAGRRNERKHEWTTF